MSGDKISIGESEGLCTSSSTWTKASPTRWESVRFAEGTRGRALGEAQGALWYAYLQRFFTVSNVVDIRVGPISSVSALGTTMIIVNDLKIALDLLEKRSSIYSSRPTITFGGEMYAII